MLIAIRLTRLTFRSRKNIKLKSTLISTIRIMNEKLRTSKTTIRNDLNGTTIKSAMIMKFQIMTVNLINFQLLMPISATKISKSGKQLTIKRTIMNRSTMKSTTVKYRLVNTSNTKSDRSGSKIKRLRCHKFRGSSSIKTIRIKRRTFQRQLRKN